MFVINNGSKQVSGVVLHEHIDKGKDINGWKLSILG